MVSAFTASELVEMLPSKINVQENIYYLSILKQDSYQEFDVRYWSFLNTGGLKDPYIIFINKNLADAMAKMLIYLLESGLMKLK